MGKVAGHPVIVRLEIKMTGRNVAGAGHHDRHIFSQDQSIIFETKTNNIDARFMQLYQTLQPCTIKCTVYA